MGSVSNPGPESVVIPSPHPADALELHPEVLHAAQHYFGLQPTLHGGRALVGDAAQLVPRLGVEGGPRYDFILHDVFR